MAKRRMQAVKHKPDALLGLKLPVLRTLEDCQQLSEDHWQGIDTANGATVDVRGGAIPERLRLLAFVDGQVAGFIRLIPAHHA